MKLFFYILLSIMLITKISWAEMKFDFIVHNSVKKDKYSKDELIQIFKAQITKWSTNRDIVLVVFEESTEVGHNFAEHWLGMTSKNLSRHYLKKVFAGVLAKAPIRGEDPQEVVELVEENRRSIGYVPHNTNIGNTKKVTVTNYN